MGIKTCKKGGTSIFIVNKRLREAKVKFLIEHDKNEFKYCIIHDRSRRQSNDSGGIHKGGCQMADWNE